MKKIVLICCGGLLFTAMTCTKDSDTQHHHISFYNASASDIYICRGHNHSDTTLLYVQDVTTPGWFCEVKSHSVNNQWLRYPQNFMKFIYIFTKSLIEK